jgi:hypothetical protein
MDELRDCERSPSKIWALRRALWWRGIIAIVKAHARECTYGWKYRVSATRQAKTTLSEQIVHYIYVQEMGRRARRNCTSAYSGYIVTFQTPICEGPMSTYRSATPWVVHEKRRSSVNYFRRIACLKSTAQSGPTLKSRSSLQGNYVWKHYTVSEWFHTVFTIISHRSSTYKLNVLFQWTEFTLSDSTPLADFASSAQLPNSARALSPKANGCRRPHNHCAMRYDI